VSCCTLHCLSTFSAVDHVCLRNNLSDGATMMPYGTLMSLSELLPVHRRSCLQLDICCMRHWVDMYIVQYYRHRANVYRVNKMMLKRIIRRMYRPMMEQSPANLIQWRHSVGRCYCCCKSYVGSDDVTVASLFTRRLHRRRVEARARKADATDGRNVIGLVLWPPCAGHKRVWPCCSVRSDPHLS